MKAGVKIGVFQQGDEYTVTFRGLEQVAGGFKKVEHLSKDEVFSTVDRVLGLEPSVIVERARSEKK